MVCASKLTLPSKIGCNALSVTYGDSSPKGRAKVLGNLVNILTQEVERIDTLHELFYEYPAKPEGFAYAMPKKRQALR